MPLAKINGKILHFVHIPKTGGSCVTSYLRAKGKVALYSREQVLWSRTTPQHMEFETRNVMVPEGFSDGTFAILRDPLERILSEFRYRATRRNGRQEAQADISTSDELAIELDWNQEFHGTFDQWVKLVFSEQRKNPYMCDNHIRPQTEFVSSNTTIFMFDDGLDPVLDWIDRVTNTPRASVALDRNESVKFSIEMHDQTRQMIAEFYAGDYAFIEKIKATNVKNSLPAGSKLSESA